QSWFQPLKPRTIAGRCKFNLDDVCASFGQETRAGRTGDKLRNIEHAIPAKHFRSQTHILFPISASVEPLKLPNSLFLAVASSRVVSCQADCLARNSESPACSSRRSSIGIRSLPQNCSPRKMQIGTPKI